MMVKNLKQVDKNIDTDYTLTNVPQHARKNGLAVFVVLLGFTFLATSMAAGANVGVAFNMTDLLWILLIGALILSVYAGSLSWIAAKAGVTSMLLALYSLGKIGSKWADIILGGTQIFWYAVQSAYIGTVFTQALNIEEYF